MLLHAKHSPVFIQSEQEPWFRVELFLGCVVCKISKGIRVTPSHELKNVNVFVLLFFSRAGAAVCSLQWSCGSNTPDAATPPSGHADAMHLRDLTKKRENTFQLFLPKSFICIIIYNR